MTNKQSNSFLPGQVFVVSRVLLKMISLQFAKSLLLISFIFIYSKKKTSFSIRGKKMLLRKWYREKKKVRDEYITADGDKKWLCIVYLVDLLKRNLMYHHNPKSPTKICINKSDMLVLITYFKMLDRINKSRLFNRKLLRVKP